MRSGKHYASSPCSSLRGERASASCGVALQVGRRRRPQLGRAAPSGPGSRAQGNSPRKTAGNWGRACPGAAWLALLALLAAGCGYSEDEWQRQLDAYGKLNGQYEAEQRARLQVQTELEQERERAGTLSQRLAKRGSDVERLSRELEAEGTKAERLNADLSEKEQALDEYKRRAAQLERIRNRFEALREKLKALTKIGLKVEVRHNRQVISLPGDLLFASGKDTLRDGAREVLDTVAEVVRNDEQLSARFFQVAGHTDSSPLSGGPFRDNWGLSAMRARRVLVYLISSIDSRHGGGGLSAEKLHAAGYADTDPVAPNKSRKTRALNRRVELVLMPNVEEMLDLNSLL